MGPVEGVPMRRARIFRALRTIQAMSQAQDQSEMLDACDSREKAGNNFPIELSTDDNLSCILSYRKNSQPVTIHLHLVYIVMRSSKG